jgi:hypothetical protein
MESCSNYFQRTTALHTNKVTIGYEGNLYSKEGVAFMPEE